MIRSVKKRKILLILLLSSILLLNGCAIQRESGVRISDDILRSNSQQKSTYNPTEEDVSQTVVKTKKPDFHPYEFTLSFAGDMNFDENWSTMQFYNTQEDGIYDCISNELIQEMRAADMMCINNEFTYSSNGAPMDGKAFTFRAKPSRVEILNQLGVDIVTLANNHVYDYGKQAFLDTMDTLKNENIKYFGAGKNLKEAMSPVYVEIQGKKIAYVGASRAEKYKLTPQAKDDSPGILRCYDTDLFVEMIKEARKNADFVIAYVHWGTEGSFELEDVQVETGKLYIDSGADVIIGAHPHNLQGMEFYKGKPIVYSLGNFWFNKYTTDTVLLNLNFSGDDNEGSLNLEIVPAVQEDHYTGIVTDEDEKERIFSLLEDISINVAISGKGIITEAKS